MNEVVICLLSMLEFNENVDVTFRVLSIVNKGAKDAEPLDPKRLQLGLMLAEDLEQFCFRFDDHIAIVCEAVAI